MMSSITSWRKALQTEDSKARQALEWTSTSLILLALGTMPLEANPAMWPGLSRALWWIEISILGIFTAEYLLRLWIAERPLKYALSPYGLIDLMAIAPVYLAGGAETSALRGLRLLRLIRLLKNRRYAQACARLVKAIYESREEAAIFAVASALTVYIAAVGIHQFEHQAQPEAFGTLGQSLWWSVGLLVDVEYGEIYPVTVAGRAFAAVLALVGIAIVAVPAGLVASALSKVARKQDAEQEEGE